MNELLIEKILKLLPHRYPFLLIDRVIDYDLIPGDEWIKGLKNVTINEPFFQGHFPAQPVMPGVLILEGMAQISGLLPCLMSEDSSESPKLGFFAGCDKIRWKKPVIPGDQLIYKSHLLKMRRNLIKCSAVARVEKDIVASAEIMIVQPS